MVLETCSRSAAGQAIVLKLFSVLFQFLIEIMN